MTKDLHRELELVYSINWDFKRYFLPNITKLFTTNMSLKTLNQFDEKINSLIVNGHDHKPEFKSDVRLLMFSGHDDNIYPFMKAFKLTNVECLEAKYKSTYTDYKPGNTYSEDPNCRLAPSFASSFIFELSFIENRNLHESFFVKVKFNGTDLKLKDQCKNAV